jgi:hypothetical protein
MDHTDVEFVAAPFTLSLEPSVFATYSIGCSVDDSKIRKATTPAFD